MEVPELVEPRSSLRPVSSVSSDRIGSLWPLLRRRPAGMALALLCALALTALLGTGDGARGRAAGYGPPPGASAATAPVPGERYLWRPVAIGGGGFITGIAFDRSGAMLVARSDVHGVYRWDATVDRWVQLVTAASMPADARRQYAMNAGVYEIAVAPGDPRRLYMAVKGRVYRSDDGGAHWIAPALGAPFPLVWDANAEFRLYGPFLAVSPKDADIVVLGTPADGLWRSADAGAHWARVQSVPPAADLRPAPGSQAPGILVWFAPDRSGRVFAASAGHGLFVSDAAGAAFAPAAPDGPQTIARADFGADGALYAIDQEARQLWALRGGRWHELSGAGGLSPAIFAGVAADPHGARVLVTDAGGRAWCSIDGGASWSGIAHGQTAGAGDPPWLALYNGSYFASGQIAFDPAVANRLWVAAGTGPYVARIGAGCAPLAWASRARGIEELVAEDVVQPPGHAPLFAALDFGIHLKPDLDAFSTSYGPRIRSLIAAQKLDWSPSDPAFIVTNASDTRTFCCAEDGDAVLAGYSTDGGVTWRKFATLPTPPGTRPDDPWRMAFGTIAVAADSTANIVWAPAYDRSPFYTRDRGASWQRVVLPGETLPATGSFDGIWLPRRTLAADRVLPGTFYLVHSGDGANAAIAGLWRTHDGGRSWIRAFAGEIAPESRYAAKLRAVPGKAGHLFFTSAIEDGPDTRLRRSIDGGTSWTVIDGVDHVDDIGFGKAARGGRYPTLFVSGRVGSRYGIWRSVDDAASWHRVAGFPDGRLDQVNVVEGDKDVFGRVYVGYTGSGWLYGEPAPCRPAPMRPVDDRQCTALDEP